MFDVGIAMQNLVLAAHSLGLGTVHVGLVDARKAAEILGLPPGIVFVEMTPLGYPNEQPRVIPRKELSEIVFYEKYGQKCRLGRDHDNSNVGLLPQPTAGSRAKEERRHHPEALHLPRAAAPRRTSRWRPP